MIAHPDPLGKHLARALFLQLSDAGYRLARRGLFYSSSAQTAHERLLDGLRQADHLALLLPLIDLARELSFRPNPVTVGEVTLDSPLMLAAGLVKGDGFASEDEALAAVERGENIIPGWLSIPRLVGLVEFGSFTRWPRLGNPGTVVWRDVPTYSTQNRVGLRNPGVAAAAAFLARQVARLPAQFGINIAVTPGVEDPDQQTDDVLAGLQAFLGAGVYPTWFTLNLSCPNTQDDPQGNQGADLARQLGGAAVAALEAAIPAAGRHIPLWVKVSPGLAEAQYRALIGAFEECGVAAVIATNTLGQPAPTDAQVQAGVGGGRLHAHAVAAARVLMEEKLLRAAPVEVIGCGGIIDGRTCRDFTEMGIPAVQYWSALVFRGPLAAALIAREAFGPGIGARADTAPEPLLLEVPAPAGEDAG